MKENSEIHYLAQRVLLVVFARDGCIVQVGRLESNLGADSDPQRCRALPTTTRKRRHRVPFKRLSNPTAHKSSFRLTARPSYSYPPDFSRGTMPPKEGNQSSSSGQDRGGQGTVCAYPNTTHRITLEHLLLSQMWRSEKREPSSPFTHHPSRKLTNGGQ